MNTMIVRSSWGTLKVDKDSGEVIICERIEEKMNWRDPLDYIYKIQRFDIPEWKLKYPGKELPDNIDILDLGFWRKDGHYESADQYWRKQYREMKEEGL